MPVYAGWRMHAEPEGEGEAASAVGRRKPRPSNERLRKAFNQPATINRPRPRPQSPPRQCTAEATGSHWNSRAPEARGALSARPEATVTCSGKREVQSCGGAASDESAWDRDAGVRRGPRAFEHSLRESTTRRRQDFSAPGAVLLASDTALPRRLRAHRPDHGRLPCQISRVNASLR